MFGEGLASRDCCEWSGMMHTQLQEATERADCIAMQAKLTETEEKLAAAQLEIEQLRQDARHHRSQHIMVVCSRARGATNTTSSVSIAPSAPVSQMSGCWEDEEQVATAAEMPSTSTKGKKQGKVR